MAIYKQVTLSDFRNEFATSQYANKYSYEALEYMFNYLNSCVDDYELDIAELAGYWSEYSSVEEFRQENGYYSGAEPIDAWYDELSNGNVIAYVTW